MKPLSTRTQGTARPGMRSHNAGEVTLDMVAREAGVSPSTVSRILNGTAAVNELKQLAVEAAIAKLGFRPNPVARGLAGGRTMSIGVVTQTISSPFYGEAMHGIEDGLERQGYMPLFVSGHWQDTEERKAIEALLSRRVDGVIVLAGRIANQALLVYARRVPMVVVGRDLQAPGLHSVCFENRAGARLATRHLIDFGHERIAFIAGDAAHEDALERAAGYREALQEAGLKPDPQLVVAGDFTESGGVQAVNQLLDRRVRFTAIFAANDQSAIGAAVGLHRRQVRVPDDVSLVGFDDVAPAKFSIPPLTTVRQSIYEMGRQAAGAVLALIGGEQPQVALPALQLVARESTRRILR